MGGGGWLPHVPSAASPRSLVCKRRAARRGTHDALWSSRRRRRLPSLAQAALRASQTQVAPRAVTVPERGPSGVIECHAHSSLGWAVGRRVPDDQGWCRGGWEGTQAEGGPPREVTRDVHVWPKH